MGGGGNTMKCCLRVPQGFLKVLPFLRAASLTSGSLQMWYFSSRLVTSLKEVKAVLQSGLFTMLMSPSSDVLMLRESET